MPAVHVTAAFSEKRGLWNQAYRIRQNITLNNARFMPGHLIDFQGVSFNFIVYCITNPNKY